MVEEYKMFQAWKRSEEDEDQQLEALFDALYATGRVTEHDVLFHQQKMHQGYLYPKRQAVRKFLRHHNTYEGDAFWDKFACYNHSPIELANLIVFRTQQALKWANEGTVTYVRTGAPAVSGRIVCMGQMMCGHYITNPAKGAPRQLIEHFTAQDVLLFLGKYSQWLKDPLLMFGLWRTYTKNDHGPWIMCLCHHLGTGQREDYYEYGFDAGLNAIDYIGTKF